VKGWVSKTRPISTRKKWKTSTPPATVAKRMDLLREGEGLGACKYRREKKRRGKRETPGKKEHQVEKKPNKGEGGEKERDASLTCQRREGGGGGHT